MSRAEPELTLSIVIVTHRRVELLAKCLASVAAARVPVDAEILIVVNGPDPATEDFLRRVTSQDPQLIVLAIASTSPAAARNAAVERAQGAIVYFLDDDVTIVADLFPRVLRVFADHPDVGVVGGPNLTPPGSSRFERCTGRVLESPFGSGAVRRRYSRTGEIGPADDRSLILCNLAIRRRAFADIEGPFPEHVVCNEENILLAGLAARGVRMLHDPNLVVYHARRSTFVGFCQQIFRYGRGRWQNTVAVPGSLSPTFLIPTVFLLYVLSIPLVCRPMYLAPLALYGTVLLGFALAEARRVRDPATLPLFLVLYPACHLSYPAGFVSELARSLRDRIVGRGSAGASGG